MAGGVVERCVSALNIHSSDDSAICFLRYFFDRSHLRCPLAVCASRLGRRSPKMCVPAESRPLRSLQFLLCRNVFAASSGGSAGRGITIQSAIIWLFAGARLPSIHRRRERVAGIEPACAFTHEAPALLLVDQHLKTSLITRMLLLLLLLMASLRKHPSSPFWIACFRDSNGSRTTRDHKNYTAQSGAQNGNRMAIGCCESICRTAD
jgi:hypothetical protein